MNRSLQTITLSLLMLCYVTLNSFAQSAGETFTVEGITYTVLTTDDNESTVELTAVEAVDGYFALPESITHNDRTYTITAIGAEAFLKTTITDLDLTAATRLQRIGTSAFADCKQLVNVIFPDRANSSLTIIEPLAFLHCKSLASFNLEDTHIKVLETLFSKNEKDEISFRKLTSLRLPQSLRTIKKYALQFLDILEIEIPSGVTTIEERAIEGCVYLTDFTWKNAQVTKIPAKTFLGDDKLERVTILSIDPLESDAMTDNYFFMCDKDLLQVRVTPESYDNLAAGGYSNETSVYSTLVAVTDWTPAQRGDANGDGTVNAADIVEVVNYIMGNESDGFIMLTADANNDGKVNAADIVVIVNMIMSGQ